MHAFRRKSGLSFQPFHPRHLAVLDLQEEQSALGELIRVPSYGELLANDFAWSLVGAEGAVHCCGGILPRWPGLATAWMLIGEAMPRRAWPVAARRGGAVMAAARREGYRRIEADVKADFVEAVRFAQRMGFVMEWYMDGYTPEGDDYWRAVWRGTAGGRSAGGPADGEAGDADRG